MSDISGRSAVLTRDTFGRTEDRIYPLKTLKVAATSLAAAQVLIEAPENEIVALGALNFSNGTTAAVDVSVMAVPNGEVAGDQHIIIDAIKVEPNGYISLENHFIIAPLSQFLVFASAADSVRVSGWIKASL